MESAFVIRGIKYDSGCNPRDLLAESGTPWSRLAVTRRQRIYAPDHGAGCRGDSLELTTASKPGQRSTFADATVARVEATRGCSERPDVEFPRPGQAVPRSAAPPQEDNPLQLLQLPNCAESGGGQLHRPKFSEPWTKQSRVRECRSFKRCGGECRFGDCWCVDGRSGGVAALPASQESCPQRRNGGAHDTTYRGHNRTTGSASALYQRTERCNGSDPGKGQRTKTQPQPAGHGEPDQAVRGSVKDSRLQGRLGGRPQSCSESSPAL